MKTSLIIPTYQRGSVLCNAICLALQQDYENYEIIVVDQNEYHDSSTADFLNSLPKDVRIIRHTPPSLTGARNRGIKEANGEVLIMIDDDVTFKRNFIAQHVKYYQNAEIGAVTGRIEERHNNINRTPSFVRDEFLKWISPSQFSGNEEKIAYRLAGGNFSVRKELAIKARLFDVNFIGTAWGEEYDFSLRLRSLGKLIIYNPEAYVFHLGERQGGVGNRKRFDFATIYSKFHNLSYLVKKNNLDRRYYFYLIWYASMRCFYKKDYLNIHGFNFILLSQFHLIKGLCDGHKKATAVIRK